MKAWAASSRSVLYNELGAAQMKQENTDILFKIRFLSHVLNSFLPVPVSLVKISTLLRVSWQSQLTHSVLKNPGRTALTLTLGP